MATVSLPGSITTMPVVPAEDGRYEIVRGKRVELPPMSAYAGLIASRLLVELAAWCKAKKAGQAVGEVLFRLPLPGDEVFRRPDVAYVSYERWPKTKAVPKDDNAWDVVPDLAIEVISPTDRAEDAMEKVEEYFQAGVQQVWVVYPRRRIVLVFASLAQIRGLTHKEELDGGQVLPGFRLTLAELFSEETDNSK